MTDPHLTFLPTFITAPDSQALCSEVDPDAWFPEKGGPVRWVKETCRRCELVDPCGEWALANDVLGIWGGLTEFERRDIKAGRPPLERKPARTWTDAGTRGQVVDLLRRGWSATEIAREVGISDRTVHRIRARHEQENAA